VPTISEGSRADTARMSIMEHLSELRTRLIWAFGSLVVAALVAFIFRAQILDFLRQPLAAACRNLPERETFSCDQLYVTSPTDAFNISLKVATLGGLVLASPMLFAQLWLFVAPGLTPREKRWAVPSVSVAVFLFLLGLAFAYFSLSRGLGFLLGFAGDSIESILDAQRYLSFALTFLIVFGLAFEFPLLVMLATLLNMVSSRQLRTARPWAIVAIFVVAAIITPSGDPITLLLMGVPLCLFYEAAIWGSRLLFKK